MLLYFAPMEGLTGGVYRRAHAAVFGGVDRYFTPFYSPVEGGLSKKDLAALDEDDRQTTVPQLLTRRAADFLSAVKSLSTLGYREVNLNLGCPSGTVSAKHKGAGFLLYPDDLRDFFDEVFDGIGQIRQPMRITVKSRIGYGAENEFPALLELFNSYPIAELILHPRLRMDFYRGKPRMAAYQYAAQHAKMPLCYNGDVFSAVDYQSVLEKCGEPARLMLGRGAVANPALFAVLRGDAPSDTVLRMRRMHDMILEENCRRMGSGKNLLCRMADLWNYQIHMFDHAENTFRRIRHAADLAEYRAAVATLFRECPLRPSGAYIPPNKP